MIESLQAELEPDRNLTIRTLSALNHPLRIAILEALAREPSSASRLSRSHKLPLSNTSYHLCKILYEECRLVTVVSSQQRRGAMEKTYGLKPEALLGMLLLRVAAAAESPGSAGICATVQADEQGRQQIAAAIEELKKAVHEVENRCVDGDPTSLRPLTVGAAVFEVEA